MKILMFGWELPPFNSGGLGTACFGLCQGLARAGVEVIFVLPKKQPVTASFMQLIFAGVRNLGLTYGSPVSFDWGGSGLLSEVHCYAQCARLIAGRVAHDVIHAHDWLTFLAGLAAKEVSGKPLIAHVHATEFDRTGGLSINQDVYEIEGLGMRAADAVITVSGYTKDMVMKHYGIPAEKIFVVHNGINPEDYGPAQYQPGIFEKLKKTGTKIVIFVGRITLQKGPEYFIRAAKKVLERRPRTLFVLAGTGDLLPQVVEETAWLGIADKVMFAGFLRGAELNSLYQAADLFVLPSVSEPFGITPLEALINGTPVLLSRQSGVSEVLRHALRVDFWDIEEMANKIIAVLDYRPLHHCLLNYGKKEAENLTWEKAASRCQAVYQRLGNL